MRTHRVRTLRMKNFDKWHGKMKLFKYTRILQNWPQIKVHSKWYFQAKGKHRVYLKVGWNVIGCQKWNNIQIMEKRLHPSCEISIRVTEDHLPPLVYDEHRSCLFNGSVIEAQSFNLFHDSEITVKTTRRYFVFHFFNKDLDIEF